MQTAKRVLIVDDEADIREGVKFWLGAVGFETSCAADGDAGVASAQADPPDAILLDVLMPRKDGMQTLADLHGSPKTQDIPVVMLSASLRDEQRALEAGASYFVHKPYNGRTLVRAVQAAIGRN